MKSRSILVAALALCAAVIAGILLAAIWWHTLGPSGQIPLVRTQTVASHHEPEREDESGQRVSGAMRSLDFWAEQRAYPGRIFPERGYLEAFELAKRRLPEATAKVGAVAPWQALGPHNFGGRTLALAFNPQNPGTIYAGSASGGLWRSTTGGVGAAAWQLVPTGYPVLAVGAIAIAPGDSNVIYIGTGEVYAYGNTQGGITERLTRGSYGIGVLKTSDGGQTWTKSLDWSANQQRGVQVIRIDPQHPEVVWAGTTEGTYKSYDAGQVWQRVNATIMVTDLVINPAHPDTVFIACGDLGSAGAGVYRTLDGGASWTQMSPGVIPDYLGKAHLSICESQPNIVYASCGNGGIGNDATFLVKTTTNGDVWYRVSTTDYASYQGWYSHDVEVNPDNPNIVLAAGIDIWKSTSGGTALVQKSYWDTWYFGQTPPGGPEGPPYYSHADHHDLVYHPLNRNIIYLANDGGVFRSLDGGETFEGCNGGYQTQQFYAGFSSSRNDSQLALGGMQDNATAIYVGSDAWVRVIGGDGGWTAIDPTNDAVLYGSAQYLYLLKSTSGGSTWSYIEPPNQGTTGFIAPYALAGPGDPQVIYAGRSIIFRSYDGGAHWPATNGGLPLDGNPALAVVVSQTNSNVAYVTTAPVSGRGHLYRTTNAGDTYSDVTGSLPDRYLVGLTIDPTDDQTIYVTLSGFGSSHLFKSTSGGDSWQDVGAGLPDVPTQSVVVDPFAPGHVYVGNDIGVYFSASGGGDWQGFSLGLPDAVSAMDLTISATSHKLRVSTYGNGVYERPLLSSLVDVPAVEPVIARMALRQNVPNPFNPATDIRYHLATAGDVELAIFDVAGRRVRTLVRQEQPSGEHSVRWDGRDGAGREAPGGVYLYRLQSGGQTEARKMLLAR